VFFLGWITSLFPKIAVGRKCDMKPRLAADRPHGRFFIAGYGLLSVAADHFQGRVSDRTKPLPCLKCGRFSLTVLISIEFLTETKTTIYRKFVFDRRAFYCIAYRNKIETAA
jgi:hypothetical protein